MSSNRSLPPDRAAGTPWLFSARPRARTTDPLTSHAAADSFHPGRARALQYRVWLLLETPASDLELVRRWRARWPEDRTPESSIRTRRSELVTAGQVEAAGQGVMPSGRRAIIWRRRVPEASAASEATA